MAQAARGACELRHPAAVLLAAVLLLAGGAQAADAGAAHCLQLAAGSTVKCRQCQEGYFADAGGRCVQCGTAIASCVECQSVRGGAKCTMCRAGTRLSLQRNRCQRCRDRKCLLCPLSASRCGTCKEGYVPDANGRCIPCAGCSTGCRRDGTCPAGCISGFGKVNGRCVKCRQSEVCHNCDGNPAVCRSCRAVGLRLVKGRCERCSLPGCALCQPGTNAPVCQQCAFGWFKFNGGCVQCQRGCVENACRSDGTCTKCKGGWGLVDGGYCFECQVYAKTKDNVARQACEKCDGDNYSCQKCKTHFGLFPFGECRACSWDVAEDDTCEQCNGDTLKCSFCSPNEYLMDNGLCKRCWDAIPNCRACRNGRKCTQCWTGHALVNRRCRPCPTGCDDCGTDPTRCLRCDGYHVLDQGSGRCVPLPL